MESRHLIILAFLAPALAGCLQDEATPPQWAPIQWAMGDAWEFSTTTAVSASQGGVPFDANMESTVRIQVVNTSALVANEPAYVVQVDGGFHGFPILPVAGRDGGIGLVRQEDLAVIPVEQYGFAAAPFGPECDAHAVAGPSIQWLEVPLQTGLKWRHGPPAGMEASVEGYETVDVPAGSFAAWHVRLTMDGFGSRLAIDYWFAPGVQYIVKATMQEGRPGDEQYEATLLLESFGNQEVEEVAAPVLEDAPRLAGRWADAYQIVADQPLPVEAGPDASVRLALQEAPRDHYGYQGLVTSTPFPPDDLAPESLGVLWEARHAWGGTVVATHEGPTWEFPLDEPGRFDIMAFVDPPEEACDRFFFSDTIAESTLTTFWQQSYNVTVPQGVSETVPIDTIEVQPGGPRMLVTWDQSGSPEPLRDWGYPRLRSPFQDYWEYDADGAWGVHRVEEGSYGLEWVAEGTGTEDSGPFLPVAAQQEIQLHLRFDYI